ncbi:tyrosine phosphatase IA-2 [Brevipalpus obovatus]|uniref:tyrosine phosphatase IA-2 n=1 Tax=Brevipalpus obovatus TaxID=246614 RepID=UPI003D9DF20E
MKWLHIDVFKLCSICCILWFSISPIHGESNVGCIFNKELCEPDEICVNDNAFGRCEQQDNNKDDEEEKLNLDMDTLKLLEKEMKRLYDEGYRWDNEYTQCTIRQILYASRNNRYYDPGLCSRLLSMNKPVMTPELAMSLAKLVDPQDLALIQFDPSTKEYAIESFQPSPNGEEEPPMVPPVLPLMDSNRPDRIDKRRIMFADERENIDGDEKNEDSSKENDDAAANQNDLDEEQAKLLDLLTNQMEQEEEAEDLYPNQNVPTQNPQSDSNFERPIYSEAGTQWLNRNGDVDDGVDDQNSENPENNQETPNAPDGASEAAEQLLMMDSMINEEPSLTQNADEDEDREGENVPMENTWNFYRQHRYDIKKPGPAYYVHEESPNEKENMKHHLQRELNQEIDGTGNVDSEPVRRKLDSMLGMKKKGLRKKISPSKELSHLNWNADQEANNMKEFADDTPYEAIDGRFTFLHFISRLENWEKGEDFVRKLESLLNLPRGTFSNIRVQDDQVIFKVNPNSLGLNATTVAAKAYEMKNVLHSKTLLLLDSSGIGNKVKRGIIQSAADGFIIEPVQQHLTILTVFACFTVFSILMAGFIVYAVRRNYNIKRRLRSLIGSLSGAEEGQEATSDYEDLCRQRMQTKACKKDDTSKPESSCKKSLSEQPSSSGSLVNGKGETKSIDNGPEPSPPSRSSTSSWSEEPITSNLDISTGHMILSYMEDHLKNKDRLAKEWEALCAYEVDPCSTTAATLSQNTNKNRFADVLPFDHSRVILNDLTNSNRSDYINASTITDHDPRSPVYIVTQGPLPHTCADFWQMVWEQGSTIIVMLTRLMENGVASSARYWPEEGSASYGSFEVHLVSEHIWCDDYLVRSFFLKNTKSGETRTVTQFHYLSWPENGVPPNPRSLLEFRRKVNKSFRGRSCPIVVHCSDGIGRTGTYCLIDMVLNRLAKGAKEIDIAATLEHIRDQRGNSVKTKAQFEFVLEALAEEVSAILKTLKSN